MSEHEVTNHDATPCPSCGYCPTCGRTPGNVRYYPAFPYPSYPWQTPWISYDVSGNTTSATFKFTALAA